MPRKTFRKKSTAKKAAEGTGRSPYQVEHGWRLSKKKK